MMGLPQMASQPTIAPVHAMWDLSGCERPESPLVNGYFAAQRRARRQTGLS